jgi:MoxR-like ATPase
MEMADSVQEVDAKGVAAVVQQAKQVIGTNLFGMERAIEELFIALLAGGHILLEDVPGVGKTALAKAFAAHLGLSFHRIQCTPDLLPGDIVGGLILDQKTGDFRLRKGPVFAHILLVDEINRALPRTQSALLEAMAEGQVTIDGEAHPLPQPFMVIATQNPLESQGVFPLPEAQIDRFLLKTTLGYPDADQDVALLTRHLELVRNGINPASSHPGPAEHAGAETAGSPSAVPTLLHDAEALRYAAATVSVHADVLAYISRIAAATRAHADVEIGASPRGMIMLTRAAQAAAAVSGRDWVVPDDVKRVAPIVLHHRLVFRGYQGAAELSAAEWTAELLTKVTAPVDGQSA